MSPGEVRPEAPALAATVPNGSGAASRQAPPTSRSGTVSWMYSERSERPVRYSCRSCVFTMGRGGQQQGVQSSLNSG